MHLFSIQNFVGNFKYYNVTRQSSTAFVIRFCCCYFSVFMLLTQSLKVLSIHLINLPTDVLTWWLFFLPSQVRPYLCVVVNVQIYNTMITLKTPTQVSNIYLVLILIPFHENHAKVNTFDQLRYWKMYSFKK